MRRFHRRMTLRRVRTVAPRAALLLLPLALASCEAPLEPTIEIVTSETSVRIEAVRGASAPVTHTVIVSNSGGGRLGPVSCAASPAAWLTCAVSGGNAVVLTANPTGLTTSPGPVPVVLTAPGASNAVSLIVDFVIQQPVIGLSGSNVSFTAMEGGSTTPASATVTVTNVGAGTLADLGGLTCAPSPATNIVTCSVNQATGALTITPNVAALAPGSYTYVLNVSAPNAGAVQSVSANITVGALPRIVLTPSTIQLQAVRGTGTPIVRSVSVSNSGSGSLGTITCPSNPASWLTCTVTAPNTLAFTANPSGLTASPNPVAVPVSATGAANSPQAVTVSMTLEQPVLALSSGAVSFTVTQGTSQVTPAQHVISILNEGAGTLQNLGSVTCVPAAGSPVNCAVNTAQGTLILTVSPGGLPAGTTVYPVVVTSPNSSVQRTLAVSVVVTRATTLVLSPNALHFQAVRGSTAAMSQTVEYSNSGGGSLGTVTCLAPVQWVSCQVSPSDSSVTITANPTGLTQSPTVAQVQVNATGDLAGSKTVSVTLVIQQPVLTLSTSQISFTATAPATTSAPASITVQVTNAGGGSLGELGAITCSAPAPVSCSLGGAGVLLLSVNPTGLTPGDYVYLVTVSAANASNPAQTLVVRLTVS